MLCDMAVDKVVRPGLVVAMLVAALSAGSEANSASPRLAATEYRAQAAAICRTADHQLNTQPKGTLVEMLQFSERASRVAYAALARLNPPLRLASMHAEMLTDTRALLDGYPALIKAAKTGRAAFTRFSAEHAEENKKLSDRVSALWVKLGVPSCND